MQNNFTVKGLMEELKNAKWEVKTLGEIVDVFKTGEQNITRSFENNGDYPCVTCTDIFESEEFLNKFKTFADLDTIKTKTYVEVGDILIATSGYTSNKKTNGLCAFLGNEKPLAGNDMYVLKHRQNPKYLTNYLSTSDFREGLKLLLKKQLISVMKLYLKDIKKIKVPIPSPEIQEKIADFLFNFSEHDRKLKEEMEKRRKQFHFYKEQIFEGVLEKCRLRSVGWEVKELGQIATEIYSGSGVSREQLDTGEFPAVKCGDINTHLSIQFNRCRSFVDLNLIKKPKYFEHGDILISKLSNRRSTIGKTKIYLGKDRCLAGSDVEIIKNNQNINGKYLNYSLSIDFSKRQIENFAQSGTVFHLYTKDIKKLKIPIPPLEEQERIVNMLDKFYDICENPDKGIQLLIRHNQKQYEYYKDLIFDHMKVGA